MALSRQEKLMDLIQHRRSVMHTLATLKGMQHPDVLTASQKLDELIVEFFRMKKESPTGAACFLPMQSQCLE